MRVWTSPDGSLILTNTHRETGRCILGTCSIHNPDPTSRMNIEGWTYSWYKGSIWRLCMCDNPYWHPDGDDEKFHVSREENPDNLMLRFNHPCCGCCDSAYMLNPLRLPEE